MREQIS